MDFKEHIGKFVSFVGITIIAINQFLQLISYEFTLLKLIAISIIVFFLGLLADEIIVKKRRKS